MPMHKILLPAALVAALACSAAVVAQNGPASGPAPTKPGSANPALVTAGNYAIEPGHTQILFAYDHMGFTNNVGIFSLPTGTLTLDPKNPTAAKVSVEIPIANLNTGVPKLNEHLATAQFFDAAKFPTASFVSTGVKVDGTTADISGNLTIKGITKPVVLDATFYGAGTPPMGAKKPMIGFNATTTIKRSDFGLGYGVPIISDQIELKITAAFEKQ